METEKAVKIKLGEIVLKKPTAGMRNSSALKSYENGSLNEIKFMIELLPQCVKSHPFGTSPLRASLDNLSIEEYDKLVEVLKEFMGVLDGEKVKN